MKKRLFFSLLLSFFACAQAQSFQEVVLEEFDNADQRWIEFKNNLAIYLNEAKPPSCKGEEDEIESYFCEKWETSYQSLQQNIAELHEAFWDFREKLGEVVSHHYAEGVHASYAKACVSVESTQWFTTYLEKNLFGFEPGKQQEIKGNLTLAHDVAKSFPYSFVEPPFIDPHVVEALTPPWPSCGYNHQTAIELWNGNRGEFSHFENPGFVLEDESNRPPSFDYYYFGKTEQNVFVLLTEDCGGGTGIFKGLLFVTLEVEPYFLADEGIERERIFLKRVGEYCLGDRWYGKVDVKGNRVVIVTEGYHHTEMDPQTVTLDLQHFFPSRPLNPLFAQRIVTRNEDNPLFSAVYQDKSEELLAHLSEEVSQELVQRLLMVAVKYDRLKCLNVLLDHGGDPNYFDQRGNTPLHYAAERGEFESVKKLVEKGAEINAKNFEGTTPLVFAVKRYKGDEFVNYLLKQGAIYDFVDQEGKNLFYYALNEGWSCEVAETLFSLGVKANDSEMLPRAAYLGSQLIVSHMLEQGFDIDAKDRCEETALMNCFSYDVNEELAEFLIDKGADPLAAKWDGDAPLLKIIGHCHMPFLKKCLAKGVDLNREGLKVTALYRAAELNWLEGVKVLLEHGANVNQQNPNDHWSTEGRTALHAAAQNGNLEMVKLLREHGADLAPPHIKTPFALAAEYNHKEVLRYFVEQGALE